MASTEVEKLVPILLNKEHYILHYHNMQLCLPLGMHPRIVHIRIHTELWKVATSDLEKELYKMMPD